VTLPPDERPPVSSLLRPTLAAATAVLLVATLAACGGTDPESPGTGPDVQGAGPGGPAPGASGKVADVSGRTAQVQSPTDGQVAVTWNGDTTFTEDVEATLGAVAVGGCVLVTSSDADPTATTVAATTVRIEEPADGGGCRFGAGGPGDGQRPSGAPSDLPEGLPSGAPDRARGGFGTAGKVTAVAAGGFTLSSQRPGDDGPVAVTVTVGSGTTYTRTAPARADAVSVGRCVLARGDRDDTGAVTASTIDVSDPVDGECQGGFVTAGRPESGAA
jgi:hypothetical protein